jgi:pyridoxine 5-phosphate synthase
MTKFSVNINKIATLRNARGGNYPNVVKCAVDLQRYGAEGITVHPRPDERHIRYQDVFDLRPVVTTEFNIEGNPVKQFLDLVLKAKPEQVTLVPDAVDAITSNAGWDTKKNLAFLQEVVIEFKRNGIRTSIFLDPDINLVESAAKTGTDRIELYTEAYAKAYAEGNREGIKNYRETAVLANRYGLGINAGHDLSLDNIAYFAQNIPNLLEVSIGHAFMGESLYYGFQNVVNMYLNKLK